METKSTMVSLDVYSIKFDGCRDVYPLKIIRPVCKHPIDLKEQFKLVLNSVTSFNLRLKALVGDNPKRSFFRDSLQHSATNACEYCFSCGISFKKLLKLPNL